MSVPFLACMAAAAAFYHLPPRVLPSIQAVEGGQVGMVRMNSNNTADIGLMQVNTIWVQPLARYARMTPATVVYRLRNDGCFNITAAAAVMRLYLTEAHGNSHTPDLSADYQRKVIQAATNLFARPSIVNPGAAAR